MKYQTTIVKSFFTVFILTFISSGLSAGTLGLDGKKKDKEKKEELSADGPYVIYEPDGTVCVISVTAHGQIRLIRCFLRISPFMSRTTKGVIRLM